MIKRELMPCAGQHQKSFYGKAIVTTKNGIETLISYGTPIIRTNGFGKYVRLFDGKTVAGKDVGITATTLKHIKAFCGMNKKEFLSVEMEG